MTTLLIISGLAAGLLFACKRKQKQSLDGIGKVKFYKALSEAQKQGIEFGDKNYQLTEDQKHALVLIGNRNNYKQSKRSAETGRSYSEAFYRYLNNKYRAIAGIGYIEYPFEEYIVRNDRGDAIIIFHDYDRNRDLKNAIDLATDFANNPEQYGEFSTYAYIAGGGKFVWESKFVGGTSRVAKGVKDELFGSNKHGRMGKELHPEEKKRRRKILATEAKGGQYPEKFAEILASGGDSIAVRNGVLAALRSVTTPQDAQEILLDMYYSQFERQEENMYADTPF